MPELPACFVDYNSFGHSLKTRSVPPGSTDDLQTPDNNHKTTSQNKIGSARSTAHLPLPISTSLSNSDIRYSFLDVTTLTI